MKANGAPEKLYLHLTTGSRLLNGKYYEYKPAKIRFDDKIIEYTRTDALPRWKPTKAMLDALRWAKSEYHPDDPETLANLQYLYKELEMIYNKQI